MILRFLPTAGVALLAAAPALAGSLADPIYTPAPVAPVTVITPAPVQASPDWSGFYVGGQLGWGDLTVDGLPDTLEDSFDGSLYGLHAGYMYDFGRLVLGGEVDFDGSGIAADPFGEPSAIDVDVVWRGKLRLGYDAGRVLPYLTAGVARVDLSSEDAATDDLLEDSYSGNFAGVGASYLLSDRFMVGAEVLRHSFDDTPLTDLDSDVTTITLRGSIRF